LFVLPPNMGEWLSEDHFAWFVIAAVDEFDMTEFEQLSRLGGAGREGFDPRMLLALLIYAYAVGQRSSRQVERLCLSDVAFRVICAQDVPDHTTIARFRQRHEAAVVDLFGQVLRLCARAGLGRAGVVAIDGTKIAANASKGANRSEGWFRREAARMVAEAEAVDAAEDAMFGQVRGDELPPEWTDPRRRASRIRQALADFDAEDQAAAEQRTAAEQRQAAKARAYEQTMTDPAVPKKRRGTAGSPPSGTDLVLLAEARLNRELVRAEQRVAARRAREARANATGKALPGRRPVGIEDSQRVRKAWAALESARARALPAAPSQLALPGPSDTTTQDAPANSPDRMRNLTDPDSRLMPSLHGWVQGYNAQLAVTDDQLIIGVRVVQDPGDVAQFVPMVHAAEQGTQTMSTAIDASLDIGVVVADAGYASEANFTTPGPDRLIATGKHRDLKRAAETPTIGDIAADATAWQRMENRLRTEEGLSLYRRRAVTCEPVNGQLKDRIRLRQFARRGLPAVTAELNFSSAVHNLLKAHRHTHRN
jgi:transposase